MTAQPRHEDAISDQSRDVEKESAVVDHATNASKQTPPAGLQNVPPNGGWLAWSQVVGAWAIFFNTWGIVNIFGSFQTFYETGALFEESSSNISWIGAVQSFLLLLVGALTGPVYDAGHARALIFVGSFLVVFGLMMLSLVTEYWQAFLAQAICIGLGCGCLFVPGIAILSTYFTTKAAIAIGIAAAGSSIGGIIYPIVFHQLVNTVNFGWAVRALGFISLGTLVIPCVVMKPRIQPAKVRSLVDWSALKEPAFMTYLLGSTLGFCGLYMPFFYIQLFAITSGATDANLGFYLVPILNAASTFGRIVPNFFAAAYGPLNVSILFVAISGILIFCLIAGANLPGVVAIAVFYGFASGTFVSLPPVCILGFTKDKSKLGTRLGMSFGVFSFGLLVGTPIGGAILGSSSDDGGEQPSSAQLDFRDVWVFGGVLVLACGAIQLAAKLIKSKGSLFARV